MSNVTVHEALYQFIYDCPPIDYGWEFLPTLKAIESNPEMEWFAEEARRDWEDAADLLRENSNWEGDVTQGPCALILPDPENTYVTVAAWIVKQYNNGSTFVISRMPLYIAEDEPIIIPFLAAMRRPFLT